MLGASFDILAGLIVQYSVGLAMADARLHSGESFESLLRRFNKQVQADRILAEVRRRKYFEKPSEARKKKAAAKRRKSSR